MNRWTKRIRVTACALLCASVVPTALAGDYDQFPGPSLDPRTIDAQQQVEDIYEAGDYSRALLIYEKELAPIGDKYAQYMVGYMHLNGQGTAQSLPDALAWYRLAAERKEPAIVQARDS